MYHRCVPQHEPGIKWRNAYCVSEDGEFSCWAFIKTPITFSRHQQIVWNGEVNAYTFSNTNGLLFMYINGIICRAIVIVADDFDQIAADNFQQGQHNNVRSMNVNFIVFSMNIILTEENF